MMSLGINFGNGFVAKFVRRKMLHVVFRRTKFFRHMFLNIKVIALACAFELRRLKSSPFQALLSRTRMAESF